MIKKKIVFFFTGGTIAMEKDDSFQVAIPKMKGKNIIKAIPDIQKIADIEVIDFSNIPGPHMTPEKMLKLSKDISNILHRDDVAGVIVTHGTDTLEETAYFLDLTNNSNKPIIVTGSMQNISELSWDGPTNIFASIFTALSPSSKGKGVLVVFNNEIHAASEVVKTHTSALNTFSSPNFGPLGIIDNERVIFYHTTLNRQFIHCNKVEGNVGLIKCAVGMNSDILNSYLQMGIKGLVIEGMGRGNVPPLMMEGIRTVINSSIPVVLTSRCMEGSVYDNYGYEGGGKTLTDMGVILGGYLQGHKARIKLMVCLGANINNKNIKTIFEKNY